MRKALLSIGVSDAPPLDYLPGATGAARAMVAWARAAGYEVRELVDDSEPVSMSSVRDALLDLLRPQESGLHRLVIHFAGHGVVRSAAEDLWLLSEWQREQQAVLVPLLRRRLERFGLRQLTIVSDACRLLPDAEGADLTADGVLPMGTYDPEVPRLDHLRATSRYQSAYMLPGAGPSQDRCLFTGVLEEALWGTRPDAFAAGRDPLVVTSASLADFLEREVPATAARYGLDCAPEIVTGFRAPDDVYVEPPLLGVPAAFHWPPVGTAAQSQGPAAVTRDRGRGRGWSSSRVPAREVQTLPVARRGMKRTASVRGPTRARGADGGAPAGRKLKLSDVVRRDHRREEERRAAAEVRSTDLRRQLASLAKLLVGGGPDVVVAGAEVEAVWIAGREVQARRDGPQLWSASPPGSLRATATPLLVRLGEAWIGSALVPTCQAAWVISAAGAVGHVQPVGGVFVPERAETALAALQSGTLDPAFAWDEAALLRDYKHRDLVLGVLASYLYDAVGDVDSVRRIAGFYIDAGQPIPFDVALLARLRCTFRDGRTRAEVPPVARREPRTAAEAERAGYFRAARACQGDVAGRFPWLRQGWALLEDAPDGLVARGTIELGAELRSAPFTTLSIAGGSALVRILEGELS